MFHSVNHSKALISRCLADFTVQYAIRAAGDLEFSLIKREDQLMPTNPRDAYRGQSRSPNMVPFHMLDMFSY